MNAKLEKHEQNQENQEGEKERTIEENKKENSITEREKQIAEKEKKLEEMEKKIERKEIEIIVLRELKELDAAEELKELFINAAMMIPQNERYSFITKNVETIKKVIEKSTQKEYQKACEKHIKGRTPESGTGAYDSDFTFTNTAAQVKQAFN